MDYEKLTNPDHYKSHAVTVEPIFWCESLGFYGGNAMKYIFRAGTKPNQPEEVDLLKAAWYLNALFTVYPALKGLETGYMQLIEIKMSALKRCGIPMLQKAAQEPSSLKFFRRLFGSCVEKLCSLGLSQDDIWENIKYNEEAYRRLFGGSRYGACDVRSVFAFGNP